MTRTRIISFKGKIDPTVIIRYKYPLILTAVSCGGILCGVLTLRHISSDRLNALLEMLISFNSAGSSKNFVELFSTSLCTGLIYLFVSFVSGLCLAGKPIIMLSLAVKGLGAGLTSAYLYSLYAIDGLEYCVLMLYPSITVMFAALIVAGNESMHTCSDMAAAVMKKQTDVVFSLRVYLLRYLVPVALCTAAAALSALTSLMFSDLFSL